VALAARAGWTAAATVSCPLTHMSVDRKHIAADAVGSFLAERRNSSSRLRASVPPVSNPTRFAVTVDRAIKVSVLGCLQQFIYPFSATTPGQPFIVAIAVGIYCYDARLHDWSRGEIQRNLSCAAEVSFSAQSFTVSSQLVESCSKDSDAVYQEKEDVVVTANHRSCALKPQVSDENNGIRGQFDMFGQAQGVSKLRTRQRLIEESYLFHLRKHVQDW
jgi:hypothetical protein